MSKRIKPQAMVVADIDQAEAALAQLAALARERAALEAEMNEAIDEAKELAAAKDAPLKARQKELQDALAAFGQLNKAELFGGRKRSRELAFGTIGFRKATKITPLTKVKMADVLAKLKDYGFGEAIKTTENVNREAMRDWPDERLDAVGMRRVVSDDFFIELKAEALER